MSEFDQPDCAFSTPRRAETTTPLQALTMLNHSFTLDMAAALAERLENEQPSGLEAQIKQAYRLMFLRTPTDDELAKCLAFAESHNLESLCRVLLNTSELIYVQ